MRCCYCLLILLVFILLPHFIRAQKQDSVQTVSDFKTLNNRKTKTFGTDKDTLYLDSLSVVPASIQVFSKNNGQQLSESTDYQLSNNQIILRQRLQDSLFVHYRTLPYALHAPILRKDRQWIHTGGGEGSLPDRIVGGGGYTYQLGSRSAADALDFEGVTYNGTFARGLSMGNNQDLILNSSFNLQISGKLGDVEILGAITDNQVPLQPQGNTQQIQDFDRLFIQFKLQKHQLIAGDYDLTKPALSYFTQYYRRLQGAQLQTDFNISKKTALQVGGSFAFSKGKFARYSFQGEEGNQGPYRLKGNNGERFLIIIAGTERVFIDGVLLTRGADQDYIIDYNQGEIRFTNKRLITKDKRLVVEFSYSDLNFLRTLYTASAAVVNPKYDLYFQFYSEQDGKNQPAREALSDSAKAVLASIGDNLTDARIWSGELLSEENTDPIHYRLMDTIVNGIVYDSVLVYVPDTANEPLYSARFSLIENGKGHYIRTLQATNGAVYSWVAPDPITGAPQGTHEPIVQLVTPRQQQLMEWGGSYKISPTASIKGNIAWSNNDLNTFSKVGNADNWGWAARLTYEHSVSVGKKTDSTQSQKATRLDWRGHYEYLHPNFAFIEPYRSREFQRDWNIIGAEKANEQLFWLGMGVQGSKWGRVAYEWSGLHRDSLYFGWKQALHAQVHAKGFALAATGTWLESKTQAEQTRFIRPKLDMSYTIEKLKDWKWGFYMESEQNSRRLLAADSLAKNSFFFHIWRIYTELPATETVRCSISAQRRYDYLPLGDRFRVETIADEVVLNGNWTPKPLKNTPEKPRRSDWVQSALDWNFHYRNLRIPDTSRTSLDAKETYLGRLEYRLNLWRNFMRWTTTYELGAGQQQKIEYNYLEVDKGQGVYQWIDRNDDGIQQQNEFETAVFADQANFIRVVIFTGEFIRSNNVLLSQNIELDGQSLLRGGGGKPETKAGGVGRFFARFATRSTFQIERKTIAGKGIQAFNPFQLDIADTALVAISSVIRNGVFFNRSNPKFSAEFNQTDERSKTLLTGGFETRRRSEYNLSMRWAVGKLWSGQLLGAVGDKAQVSELFTERSYAIRFYKAGPQFTILTKNKAFRTILKYTFKHNQNTIGAGEKALSHDITTEVKYTPKKTNLSASFSWVQLQYTGAVNTPIEFAMTEGLKNGQNFLWALSFSRYLSKDNKMQLFLSYEGRKTGEARVIHTGRMQIRASF